MRFQSVFPQNILRCPHNPEVHITNKHYNYTFVRDILPVLARNKFNADALRQFLIEKDASDESVCWPDDGQFRHAFCGERAVKRIPKSRIVVVLDAIETVMRDNDTKAEKVQVTGKLTIEHIMPQGWRRRWPINGGSTKDLADHRDFKVQCWGNLTLITGSANASLSNKPWDKKAKELADHSALAMNRQLKRLRAWSENAIDKRGLELCGIAMQLWPRPEKPLSLSKGKKLP